jgi:hypothetical protein
MSRRKRRIIISGWFSFNLPHNTAGDLLAQQSAVAWATEAGYECFVAVACPKEVHEVATESLRAKDYDAVVFVCGPLTESHISSFMQKFSDIKRIALNVSIVATSNLSKEFDVIIPRDTPIQTNPDISLATPTQIVPVAGLIYVGRQREYPTQQHDAVEILVQKVVQKIGLATVGIDTKLPHNQYGLSSIAQVESVIRHMDIVITTRLHGSVLSLRNGVPPVVIDPVPEGAKVIRQMKALKWPLAYTIGNLTEQQLEAAIQSALAKQSRNKATEVITKAQQELDGVKALFIEALK